MGLVSDGTQYEIEEGIVYSFPVTIQPGGQVTVVPGLSISDFARQKMEITAKELLEEREVAAQFLQRSKSTRRNSSHIPSRLPSSA